MSLSEKLIRSIVKHLRPPTSQVPNAIKTGAIKTHTGAVFDGNDIRSARFMQSTKLVNKSFAFELIESVPPKKVTERIVSCDGGGGALGHPKVYINLDKPGAHTCGYCGLRYEKVASH
ncbi:unnamed protein product [Hymenolepis diminuta]|uniref:Zf-CHCC domain-containing protein n=1 Tax=Hymenolepis diminuta TaxID=6216 RepID=A0A0R3SR19_HYMDI|nr:unnamed protein product [Hymenolepis diminuta]VUZ56517.1 unnamed protein product [Hymenolepis diminuta]